MPNAWTSRLAELEAEVKVLEEQNLNYYLKINELELRLAEEVKWGHRNCSRDNCLSSGTDCPARTEDKEA
jgi:hypothetical protein